MTWFTDLTACPEESPEAVRQALYVEGSLLGSRVNGRAWHHGRLEISSLAELRTRSHGLSASSRRLTVREVVADVRQLHADPANSNALFQVASQFNLLEMASPEEVPENGVGIYQWDGTQGPTCAIAAGAGTIYRNYFVQVSGRMGQSADCQIDCLAGIGELLGNTEQRFWQMRNGYALASSRGLLEIQQILENMGEAERDQLRQSLRVGLHWDTQVTLSGVNHRVSQAYCSALPVAYTAYPADAWFPFATLILEAAYEATLCAGILNAQQTGNNTVYLTLLGGGAFGNPQEWIVSAIRRGLQRYSASGLDVVFVSYGRRAKSISELVREFDRS